MHPVVLRLVAHGGQPGHPTRHQPKGDRPASGSASGWHRVGIGLETTGLAAGCQEPFKNLSVGIGFSTMGDRRETGTKPGRNRDRRSEGLPVTGSRDRIPEPGYKGDSLKGHSQGYAL